MHSNETDLPIYEDYPEDFDAEAEADAETESTIDRWLANEEDRFEQRMAKI